MARDDRHIAKWLRMRNYLCSSTTRTASPGAMAHEPLETFRPPPPRPRSRPLDPIRSRPSQNRGASHGTETVIRTRLVAGVAALCLGLVGMAVVTDLTATDAGSAEAQPTAEVHKNAGRVADAQQAKASAERTERADALFERAVKSTEVASDLRVAAAELESRRRAADAEAAKQAAEQKAAEVKATSADRIAKAKAAAKAEKAAELAADREEVATPTTTRASEPAAPAPSTGPSEAELAATAQQAADAKQAADTKTWMDAAKAKNDAAAASASAPVGEPWVSLAQCESSGDWAINSGNGYYGGLQFNLGTWRSYGGQGLPNDNSPAQQIEIAKRVQAKQGWGAWPACSRKIGLR